MPDSGKGSVPPGRLAGAAENKAPARQGKARFRTASEIDLSAVYTRADLPDHDSCRDEGFPGEYPFTRGIQPTMYRGRLWTMRQYAGYGTAEESNVRYRYLLSQGQTGISIAFDLPTQLGYDSDHPLARGEVGKVGVAIDSVEDMDRLLEGIPLDHVSASMTINATAAILLCMYLAVARRRSIPPERLAGTVQNDILKEYVARGNYIYPAAPSLKLVAEVVAYCSRHLPRWSPISISGYHIREAGSTAVQEVAFTLANAIAYVEAVRQSGLPLEEFCSRLSFFFNASSDVLEEAAKFRAARRLWARIVVERFGAADPTLGRLRFHAQTSGASLAAQQPENNIVRVALQAIAAVLGGTQSLHTNSMDEALALPTERSALVALRTQQILAEESGIANTVDPLAGSYFVEWLTDTIEAGARRYIEKIDEMGGAVRAVEQGFMQREIHEAAYRQQRSVESCERIIVGVNRYRSEKEQPLPILTVSPELEAKQVAGLRDLRVRRDAAAVDAALARVEEAARGLVGSSGETVSSVSCGPDSRWKHVPGSLVERILEAVEARATVGEIAGCLRAVFGEYRESFAL
ncbi:MAG: methylmalonyl-CoA mutase [Acidobacteria bacterium]|nr:MAG: methylmalonyl-CoA mutase [Acidobacteriota bacterium]